MDFSDAPGGNLVEMSEPRAWDIPANAEFAHLRSKSRCLCSDQRKCGPWPSSDDQGLPRRIPHESPIQ